MPKTKLIGREKEIESLKSYVDKASSGHGQTVLITGDPGIGKTALVDEIKNYAKERGFQLLDGSGSQWHAEPYALFRTALGQDFFTPLKPVHFDDVFLIKRDAGLRIGHATRKPRIDEDILSGMLTAVQDFVKDSFGDRGDRAGLGKLEYKDTKILIEHGRDAYIAGVIRGDEHPDMKADVRAALGKIEDEFSFKGWDGNLDAVKDVDKYLDGLIGKSYSVRKKEADLEAERVKIYERATESVKKQKRPTMIFLDDLHWADGPSLGLLQYLARNTKDDPVLICGAYRPAELKEKETIDAMKEEKLYNAIELRALSKKETETLTKAQFPRLEAPAGFVDSIYNQTAGNPLYTTQLLQHLKDDRIVWKRADGWFVPPSTKLELPKGVHELIARRIERLSDDTIRIAEYAAAAGKEVDAAILAKATDTNRPKLNSVLDGLQSTGIVQRTDGSYCFVHPVIQEVVYEKIGWKRRVHKNLGEALEELYKDKIEDVVFDLARHFDAADDSERAIKYSIAAGDLAADHYSPEDALAHYKSALNRLEKTDRTEEQMNLLSKASETARIAGAWDKEGVLGYSNKLLELAKMTKDLKKQVEAYRNIGWIQSEQSGQFDKAFENLNKALEISEKIEDIRSIINVERDIAHDVFWRKGQYNKATEYAKKSLEHAKKINDRGEIAKSYTVLGSIEFNKGNFDTSIKYHEKGINLSKELGDLYELSKLYNNLGYIYATKRELDNAIKYYKKSIQQAEKIKHMRVIAYASANIADIYIRRNELKKAKEYVDKALVDAKKINHKMLIASAYSTYGIIEGRKKNWKAADYYSNMSLQLAEKLDPRFYAGCCSDYGMILKEKGDLDGAKKQYEKTLNIYAQIGAKDKIEEIKKKIKEI